MNILVVDDEKDMQTLFEQRFRKEIRERKVKFAFANSGEEALSYLKTHDHEAVLILSVSSPFRFLTSFVVTKTVGS